MIKGAHVIVYTNDAEADRAFFRDVLAWPHVDAHDGWLIFALPPAELACHPVMDDGAKHELYLMCEDVDALVADMRGRGFTCSDVEEAGWGRLTSLTLPGGSPLGIYEPRHASPILD